MHQFCPGFFTQDQTITSSAGLVGRLVAFQVWPVLLDDFLRSAETTSCQDNSLGLNLPAAVWANDVDASYLALFVLQKLNNLGLVEDWNPGCFNALQQASDQVAANWRHRCRPVSPLLAHPTGNRQVIQLNAVLLQPVDCQSSVVDEVAQHCFIVQVAAAPKGFLVEVGLVVDDAVLELNQGFSRVHP